MFAHLNKPLQLAQRNERCEERNTSNNQLGITIILTDSCSSTKLTWISNLPRVNTVLFFLLCSWSRSLPVDRSSLLQLCVLSSKHFVLCGSNRLLNVHYDCQKFWLKVNQYSITSSACIKPMVACFLKNVNFT